jgi:hypothetical protein
VEQSIRPFAHEKGMLVASSTWWRDWTNLLTFFCPVGIIYDVVCVYRYDKYIRVESRRWYHEKGWQYLKGGCPKSAFFFLLLTFKHSILFYHCSSNSSDKGENLIAQTNCEYPCVNCLVYYTSYG